MFWFKSSQITLDCFTARPDVYEFAQIDKANKFIPEWWKKLPNTSGTMERNMRHCPGIIEYYRRGIIIPMWSDLKLIVGEEGNSFYKWQYSDKESNLEVHGPNQWGGFLDNNKYQHFKLSSPWCFKTNKFVSFSFTQPTWNLRSPEDFIVMNGVDNYFYQSSTTINMVVPKGKESKEILIPFLQPLVNLLPMFESKIKIKTHLVTGQELTNISKKTFFSCTFNKSYYKCKNIKELK